MLNFVINLNDQYLNLYIIYIGIISSDRLDIKYRAGLYCDINLYNTRILLIVLSIVRGELNM